MRVRHPITTTDARVGELMLGEEQGKLFSLLGSDSPRCARATRRWRRSSSATASTRWPSTRGW
ncbi:hypothetical protein [Nonomuraea recticatena]|uniref:hypothetical protein n=1 Tax=Nonomuraea recticatena TaxID=46178 RepID=UPI0036172CDA